MAEQVYHTQVNGKYHIVIERAASSTKSIDGFKVEANGDYYDEVTNQAEGLYQWAKELTEVKETEEEK